MNFMGYDGPINLRLAEGIEANEKISAYETKVFVFRPHDEKAGAF